MTYGTFNTGTGPHQQYPATDKASPDRLPSSHTDQFQRIIVKRQAEFSVRDDMVDQCCVSGARIFLPLHRICAAVQAVGHRCDQPFIV